MAVTIRNLAKKADVSPATVSLALRNHPRISEPVRERIQKLADEMGYKPNPVVSHLIAQVRASKAKTYQSTLGVILTAEHHSDVKQPTVQTWIHACEARATQLGYTFNRFELHDENLSPDRLLKILETRDIHGLVATGPFSHNLIDPELDRVWKRSAVVVLGERTERPALSCVSNNQFSTAVQAVRKVLELGYQRPGLCIHPGIDDVVEHRFLGGFSAAQQPLLKKNRLPPFDYEDHKRKEFKRWFDRHRPDVILTLHLEVEAWLKTMSIRVPEDLGLVHLDHTSELKDWAGMRQNHDQVGISAIDMLIGQLHRNELGAPPFQKCLFVNSDWIPGPSVRPQSSPLPA